MLELFGLGLQAILNPQTLTLIIFSTILGLTVGALPGINGTMAMGLLAPLTFTMSPVNGVAMIAAIYCASAYGGSISAILLGIPGTISSMATVFDGHPMARQGKAGEALGIATMSSVVGGLISVIALIFLTKPLAEQALKFSPSAYFALAILGLTCIIGLGGKNLYKGLISAVLGLLISTIGIQPQTGAQRFTFGNPYLLQGIPMMPALIGLFGVLSIINLSGTAAQEDSTEKPLPSVSKTWIGWDGCKRLFKTWIRGSVIGTIVGIIPGTGASIATFVSYDMEKKTSKTPELFGQGIPEGIAAPESANNAITGGSLVPLLALGIPGNASSVFVLTALMVHGIKIGPNFITDNPSLAYGLFIAMIIANIIMAPLGILIAKYAARILFIPQSLMVGVIGALCMLGSYTISNSIFDPMVAIVFGVIAYILSLVEVPTAPLILGMILGPMMESNLQQALVISRGSFNFVYKDTITLVILLIAALSLLYPYISKAIKGVRKEVA